MFQLSVIADRGVFAGDAAWLDAVAGVAELLVGREDVALQVRRPQVWRDGPVVVGIGRVREPGADAGQAQGQPCQQARGCAGTG